METLKGNSLIGRLFVLLNSLFINRSVFDDDLQVYDQYNKLMIQSTVASKEERQILEEDHETLLATSRSTRLIRTLHWFIKIITWLYTARAVLYLYEMHYLYKIFSIESRLIVERRPSGTIYSYGCIQSNCLQLFDPLLDATRSKLNLDRLPIFSICNPTLSHYYEPFQHEYGLGSLYYATFIVYLITINMLVPKLQPRLTVNNSTLLFIVAPNLAYNMMLNRAKHHLKDMRHSYKNYIESERAKRFQKIMFVRYQDADDAGYSIGIELPQPTIRVSDLMRCKFDHIDETNYASDCLPLIRSTWWHDILIASLKKMLPIMLVDISCLSAAVCYYNYHATNRITKTMHEMNVVVVESNCSIWRQDPFAGSNGSVVELSEMSFGLNLYTGLSIWLFTVGWAMFWGVITFMSMFLYAWELRCWICELRYKLVMVKPLIRNLFDWRNYDGNISQNGTLDIRLACDQHWESELDMVFSFDKFRAQFKSEIHPSCLFNDHESFVKFTKQAENERRLEENYCQTPYDTRRIVDPERALIEILEKFYVELRLMNELKDDLEKRLSSSIIMTIAANYIISFMSISIVKMTQDFRWELMIFVVGSNIAPIALIMNVVVMSSQVS